MCALCAIVYCARSGPASSDMLQRTGGRHGEAYNSVRQANRWVLHGVGSPKAPQRRVMLPTWHGSTNTCCECAPSPRPTACCAAASGKGLYSHARAPADVAPYARQPVTVHSSAPPSSAGALQHVGCCCGGGSMQRGMPWVAVRLCRAAGHCPLACDWAPLRGRLPMQQLARAVRPVQQVGAGGWTLLAGAVEQSASSSASSAARPWFMQAWPLFLLEEAQRAQQARRGRHRRSCGGGCPAADGRAEGAPAVRCGGGHHSDDAPKRRVGGRRQNAVGGGVLRSVRHTPSPLEGRARASRWSLPAAAAARWWFAAWQRRASPRAQQRRWADAGSGRERQEVAVYMGRGGERGCVAPVGSGPIAGARERGRRRVAGLDEGQAGHT